MPSLTPVDRNEEVAQSAMQEGLMSGCVALFPCAGGLYAAMKNPNFVKLTNWQSRTAMVIMPALFIFSLSGEMKLNHRMREMSDETAHAQNTVEWAEQQYQHDNNGTKQPQELNLSTTTNLVVADTKKKETEQRELMQLYRRSVKESGGGVYIVPGDTLQYHHRAANFVKENPLKLLLAIAVPGVIHIFYGKSGQSHLSFSMKVMHTRLFGQFATLGLLLGIMGFKEFMDNNGKYITELESEERVIEMARMREQLQHKLHYKNQQQEKFQQQLNVAHAQDVKEKNAGGGGTKKKKKNKKKEATSESVVEETTPAVAAATTEG